MKAALLIVLSLSALAYAGPAFNKNNNQIGETDKFHQQQQPQPQHMTELKQTQATETLKQWCFASQMSQPELTASFKKLVGIVKSQPEDSTTEAAVMSERICQSATGVQKSGSPISGQADAQAHELIKDVYMDALIACESRECMQQLVKITDSNQVDSIRASYYMTRIAVSDKQSIKDESEIKTLAESLISAQAQPASEAIERQKLYAVTANLGKSLEDKCEQQSELKQIAEQVVKTIVERYIKPVSEQEVQQYKVQPAGQQSPQIAKKIAKRHAALKALANIPSCVLSQINGVEEILVKLAANKQELSTVRQSAIECLEQTESAQQQLKQITFDQEEPIEVRIAAYRALMTSVYAGPKADSTKQQMAAEIVSQVVKHCEEQRNQQQDDQFVLYAISHLDNCRTSEQPELQAIKESIAKNKQHYMQIQLLNKKFKQQLADVRKSSRNYKLEQEFNQIESGLIVEGDLIYESKHNTNHYAGQQQILPKLIRVNMSMPVMGETVNVVEITVRQNQMDDELLGALKLVQGAKFNSESVSKVVDSFKSSIESSSSNSNSNNKQQTAEADLSIKIDGRTVVYLCLEDFKQGSQQQQRRNTRSVYSSASIVDEIIEHLKRKPIAFNRGFNFNVNERLAKVLDVEANVIAGLRFNSKATGQSSKDFEIVAQVEPRFAFEAIVGPAKMSAKKLLQRVSTKTALGFRLRFKRDQLVDVQLELPMNTMELFTVETQMVEKNQHSYNYLPESIYGQEDIYSPEDIYYTGATAEEQLYRTNSPMRKMKRSIFEKQSSIVGAKFAKKHFRSFARSVEIPEEVARATGLRGKLRLVASPKDSTFIVQAIAQKYEPSMEGYRMQVQKIERGNEQTQYALTLSTPGSRVERTMQVRITEQSNKQRTVVKTEIQSPKMGAQAQIELVHDGRQWSVKSEMSSVRGKQWRHSFEAGVQRGSQSASGRIATTYKPYLTIDSTYLRRPVQMQGVVSYQKSPKSVISFELKSPNSPSEFVQGKLIVDERSPMNKRASIMRRSMQSPIELILTKDLTFTAEIVGQVQQQAVKVHQMLDWDSTKWSLSSELSASHKNLRKSAEPSEVVASLKVNEQQQMLTVARKCPQEERKEYRLTLASEFKTPSQHQLVAEYRFNGKRSSGLNSVVALKQKVDYVQLAPKKVQVDFALELVNTEYQFNEKLTGRTQIGYERRMKTLHTELSTVGADRKQAKIDVEYVSLGEHKIELVAKDATYQHHTTVRADQRQFACQSRTDKYNEMLAKIVVEVAKHTGDCQLVVEVPAKRSHFAADLKLGSGKLSSIAVQTPRFASKGEFSFETFAGKRTNPLNRLANLRLKSELKDKMSKDAYWMESAYNGWNGEKQSYLRFDSPLYRSDLELEPQTGAKFGLFARSKRSINQNSFYTSQDSSLLSPYDKLSLGSNKLWMLRSMISSPSMQQAARRALFEYADKREAHKHSLDYSPAEQRFNFAFDRQPNTDFASTFVGRQSVQPMRFNGDLYSVGAKRPSKMSLASEYLDFDMEAKPFDGEESYAQVNALSRHRRSPFKKHESEYRYSKQHGYKAHMKHQDAKDRRHSWQLEADESPKKWTKMSYDSEKHGKGEWEHQWRKHTNAKRSGDNHNDDQEVYTNKWAFKAESPKGAADWSHRSQAQWDEPIKMVGRVRRDTSTYQRYSPVEYLKHVNARFDSATNKNQQELYNVDFDYSPSSHARLNVQMPDEMLHSSSFEFEPIERTYKLASKLYNKRTSQPSYSFQASTKPIVGLASAEQEPQFFSYEHPMLAHQIPANSVGARLFRQPLKLDYSDKFGRVARLDYDQVAETARYAGLRQKRAAVYYKDDSSEFEHDATYDFYPEQWIAGGYKQSAKRQPGDFTLKAQTKFGPVLMHVDSSDQTVELKLVSPLVNAKLTGETSSFKRDAKLIKLTIDNKEQRVQFAKLVRKSNVLRQCEIAERIARKLDQGRWEHQSELLVSLVEEIFKFKSQTAVDGRQEMSVEGELNMPLKKTVIKIDGKRAQGQLVIDANDESASLVLDVDGKRTIQHQTRVSRLDSKFYQVESSTSYKQEPLFEMTGKVSSMVFSEPEHLFRRHSGRYSSAAEHVSTFEATLYEPKPIQVSGKYDCLNKEARIVVKNMQTKKIQTTDIKFDDQNEIIILDAQLSAPYGQVYKTQAKINLPGIFSSNKCRYNQTCQSELIYSEKSGLWSAKYVPGEFLSVNTPHGKQTFNVAY